jgi:hypothetical protein
MSSRNDKTTAVDAGIDFAHAMIHEGKHYTATFVDTEVDSGAAVDITIVTPNSTTWAHMLFELMASAVSEVSITEGAVVNVPGTALAAVNNNRNSAQTSILTLRSGDTYNAGGTVIYQYTGGSATVRSRAGSGFRNDEEIVLKANTTYRVSITSRTDDSRVSVLLEWYEWSNYPGLGAIT